MSTITALAPWFGGKRTLAPRIVEALGPHRFYVEPFCGSSAVLLAKPRSSMETVNDLHGDLVNLARVLADDDLAVALFDRGYRTLVSEGLFRETAAAWKATDRTLFPAPDLDAAWRFFVVSWMGMNGTAGTVQSNQNFAARFTANGGSPGTRFAAAVESIPAWHERLRRVTILQRDGFDLLAKIEDAKGTAIYVDPPYLVKGAKYLHDFAPADHTRLAGVLVRFKATRVVVSYYAHPDLAGLYPGWRVIDCATTKGVVSSAKRGKGGTATVAPEVLLVNGGAA